MGEAQGSPRAPRPPVALQVRRATGPVVGRQVELGAIRQELVSARAGRLTALTLEGEPGIGKTRLLVAAAELAATEGFTPLAATGDEELQGPFLLARGIFTSAAVRENGSNGARRAASERVLDAISGRDDPTLEALSPDQKLLRVFDLAAVAIRALAATKPVAVLVDDLQWADEDSVRMLRYIVRTDGDVPVFLGLATRTEKLAELTEGVTLIADMERMGMVRRLKLERFTQLETTELVQHVLGGKVNVSSAATMHAQAEGVAFIVEELARSYREIGMIQEIDGVWTLVRNAARLLPSGGAHVDPAPCRPPARRDQGEPRRRSDPRSELQSQGPPLDQAAPRGGRAGLHPDGPRGVTGDRRSVAGCSRNTLRDRPRTTASRTTRSGSSPPRCSPPRGGARSTGRSSTC